MSIASADSGYCSLSLNGELSLDDANFERFGDFEYCHSLFMYIYVCMYMTVMKKAVYTHIYLVVFFSYAILCYSVCKSIQLFS